MLSDSFKCPYCDTKLEPDGMGTCPPQHALYRCDRCKGVFFRNYSETFSLDADVEQIGYTRITNEPDRRWDPPKRQHRMNLAAFLPGDPTERKRVFEDMRTTGNYIPRW